MSDVQRKTSALTGEQANPVGLTFWSWKRGGTARVSHSDGQHLTVHSSVAYPPGAPLQADTANGQGYEMKVRSCKKLPSGLFEITGKLVNATRPVRDELAAAVRTAALAAEPE